MQPNELSKGATYPTYLLGHPARNPAWNVVYQAYREDNVVAAYHAAIEMGTGANGSAIGFYRQLEAEAETRSHGAIRKPTSWLQVEARDSIDPSIDIPIQHVIESTAARFGFSERPNTMVSILLSEVDTPWAIGRSGYFVDKIPYDKICLPERALQSEDQFVSVLSHEYAHLIALHLAEGNAPRWLNEAFATLSEGYPTSQVTQMFKLRYAPWRSDHDLELAFGAPENDEHGHWERSQAYAQSAIIGRYLQGLKGDKGFADLLRAFANHSRWKDLAMKFTGQEPVDEALKEVFGFGKRELFERSRP